MTDWLTREQRSRNMASIHSKGNQTTEARFASLLRAGRISGWRRHLSLPGRPDFVFRKKRLAVFVDGCFWHGCPQCYRLPEDNRPYWQVKIAANRRRDRRSARQLRALRWRVFRIWEHTLKTPQSRARLLAKLEATLRAY